jgi:hypothetical protein
MRRSWLIALATGLAVAALAPVQALGTTGNGESAQYQLHVEVPNVAKSPDGDTATITGEGVFSVHPKAITAEGSFTLTDDGATLSGTWTATDLLAFQPYGCGVVMGAPLPPNFCGGFILASVVLTPSAGPTMTGILRVVCIIGDVPGQYFVSKNATEGINLDVPGIDNYNEQVAGMNVFIRTA